MKQAAFPVLIPSTSFERWNRVVCFFGGSTNATVALRCAQDIGRRAKARLKIVTQVESERSTCARNLEGAGLAEDVGQGRVQWLCFEGGDLRENLYAIDSDGLIVVGAQGHGVAKELVFGSKLELIQSELPNPMVTVGPRAVV